MMGELFYYRVSPSEIKAMTWHELKYWRGWVEVIEKEKSKALEEKR